MTPMFVTFELNGQIFKNYLLKVKKTNFTDAALKNEIETVTGFADVKVISFKRAKKVGRRYVL